MSHFKVNQKDIFFILKDQLDYGALCDLERYRDLNEKALDMLVTEAIQFARGVVDPLQEIGEEHGVRFENGKVFCPLSSKKPSGNTVKTAGRRLPGISNSEARASLT